LQGRAADHLATLQMYKQLLVIMLCVDMLLYSLATITVSCYMLLVIVSTQCVHHFTLHCVTISVDTELLQLVSVDMKLCSLRSHVVCMGCDSYFLSIHMYQERRNTFSKCTSHLLLSHSKSNNTIYLPLLLCVATCNWQTNTFLYILIMYTA
jgi:hypothetical protein